MCTKSTLSLLIPLLTLFAQPTTAQQATLDKMIEQLDPSKGLQVSFEISDPDLTQSVTGEYRGLESAFHYTTEQMKAWYDGKNLWVYLAENDEINLSVPMKQELVLLNPLLRLNTINRKDFALSLKKENDGGVSLTAVRQKKDPNETLDKLVVHADKQYTPTLIHIYEEGRPKPIIVRVTNLKKGAFEGMRDKNYFKYTPNKMPGKQVIDLR